MGYTVDVVSVYSLANEIYERSIGNGKIYAYVSDNKYLPLLRNSLESADPNFPPSILLRQGISRLLASIGETKIAAVWIDETGLSAVLANGAGMMLLREGTYIPLANSTPGAFRVVTGELRAGDILIVTSSDSLSQLSGIEQGDIEFVRMRLSQITREDGSANQGFIIYSQASELKVERIVPEVNPSVPAVLAEKQPVSIKFPSLPRRPIVVGGETTTWKPPRKGKVASLIGIILLGVLGLSIFFGVRQQEVQSLRAAYQPKLKEAQFAYSEAKALSELSPARARELVLSARDTAESLQGEGIKDPELETLLAELRDNLGNIAGIYSPNIESYLTLSLISNGFFGTKIDLSEGTIRVLDATGKRLAGVEVGTKHTSIISGPEYLPDAIDVTSYADRSFILSRDGIREMEDEVSLVIKPDWNPEEILIAAFAGNMYVLDKEVSKIYRHAGVQGGFLEAEEWLAPGLSVDIADSVSWSIDGAIWVLGKDGNILKFMQGGINPFEVIGMDKPFQNPVDIFTDETLNDVYVLSPEQARIVVLSKSGQFVAEYVADQFKEAQQIVVSQEYNTLVYLAGDKLYSFELTHRRSD